MLDQMVLEHINSINDLGLIMNQRICFTEHNDVMIGKALTMLGFMKRVFGKFRDPYTLKALFMSLVR
jgi:hypothetical protein